MIIIIFDLDSEGDSRSHGSGDHNACGMYSRKREACPERDAAHIHCRPRERNQVWTSLKIVVVYAVGSRGGRQSRPTSRTPEIKRSESPLPEQRFSSRPRLSVISLRKSTKDHRCVRKLRHLTFHHAKMFSRRLIYILRMEIFLFQYHNSWMLFNHMYFHTLYRIKRINSNGYSKLLW